VDPLALLLPVRCAGCRRAGVEICGDCLRGLRRLRGPLCARCGAPTAWPVERCRECAGRRLAFARARAAVAYEEPARSIVGAWKEGGLRRLSGLAADLVARELARPEVDALAFAPADPDRGLRRGRHPAEELARALGLRWGLPVERLLVRPRTAPPQRGLARAARRRNVAGAYRATGPAPRRVCLVDDVYTTGATVNACASALRRAGARRVEVVTFARAVR